MDGSASSDAVADRTVDEPCVQASIPRWATDALREHSVSAGVGRSAAAIEYRLETASRTVPENGSSSALVDAIDERAERTAQQAVERALGRLAGECELTADQRRVLEGLADSLVASLLTDRVSEYVAESQQSSVSTDDPSDSAASDSLARLFDLEPTRSADSDATCRTEPESVSPTVDSRGNDS
ncbi:hypothetical protein [Halovivax gelatinilyticus]|uniref:hypothetical protein n=1 Tax=Halovivax gelatinilyticus TaxID=2961597 RepID=UPI0020CA6C89|nr:hypothetical protein [Halovivax gelatinilyticus]